MEITLTREKLNYAERIQNETRRAEENTEMIVPDALPDILRIVGTDAEVTVRSKDLSNGRATVSGNAAVTVVYAPDGETGLRRVNLDLPFSVVTEHPDINQNSRLTARVSLDSVDANAVNPRKIAANAAVRAELAVYNNAEVEIPTGIVPNADADIELLTDNSELSLATDVREKTFTVTDEYQIPAANPPIGELLRSNIAITADDTKVVGTKLIFKGTAHVNLLYSGAGDGEIASNAFETEFSQILELENANADSEFELIPLLTGALVTPDNTNGADGRRVAAEFHIAAQAVARSKTKFSFIGDAYGSRHALETENSQLSFENNLGTRSANTILRGTLDAPDLARIISVSARPGAVEHKTDNNALSLKCPVRVDALYVASDGTVRPASGDFTLDASIPEANANSGYSVRAETSRDVYGVAADGGIELRIPVDIRAEETRRGSYSPISAITLDADAPLNLSNLPSLVISRTNANASLWDLAKRHHSTRELILQANGLDDEDAAKGAESLIIPKKR
ncbi:MAG: DUF3794 domain-containing protein [Oscillospiraceae bacterium]|jgi:hypothetical protein|nr:DUF3794 domain-containing protein [Oscillospiraceae bacterium]